MLTKAKKKKKKNEIQVKSWDCPSLSLSSTEMKYMYHELTLTQYPEWGSEPEGMLRVCVNCISWWPGETDSLGRKKVGGLERKTKADT